MNNNIPEINDVSESFSKTSDELSEVIKQFIYNNPQPYLQGNNDSKENQLISELYHNMYNRDYIKDFAKRNFTNLPQMQEFYYAFLRASRIRMSYNREISGYGRIIEMLWDGINGWQW